MSDPTNVPERCDVCGWPLRTRLEDGCVEGNCSQRPAPKMKWIDGQKPTSADEVDIAETRRICEAATPGPWTWEVPQSEDDSRYQHIMAWGGDNPACGQGIADTYHTPSSKIPWDGKLDYLPPRHGRKEDAEFIAHSRTALPALCDALEQSRSTISERDDYISKLSQFLAESAEEISQQATEIERLRLAVERAEYWLRGESVPITHGSVGAKDSLHTESEIIITLAHHWYASSAKTRGDIYREFCERVLALADLKAIDALTTAALSAANSRVAELEADARRLDWLESEDRRVMQIPIYPGEGLERRLKWHVGGNASCPDTHEGNTLREAIDSAMKVDEQDAARTSPTPETPEPKCP